MNDENRIRAYSEKSIELQLLIRDNDYTQLKNMIDRREIDVNCHVFIRDIREIVSLLSCAAFFGRYDIFILLESHGAKHVIEGNSHSLFYTIFPKKIGLCDIDGRMKIAKYLLTHGTSPDIVDKYGEHFPLNYSLSGSCSSESIKYTKILLDHGADINKKGRNGETPLMLSVKISNKSKDLVQLLLSRGADIYLLDDFKRSALDYADQSGHKEIVHLLCNHHKKTSNLGSLKNLCITIASNLSGFKILPPLLKTRNTSLKQVEKSNQFQSSTKKRKLNQ
jgi:hypothetical protein